MSSIKITFAVDPDSDLSEAQNEIKQSYEGATEIDKFMVRESNERIGLADAASILAAAVVLVNQGHSLVEAVTKLVATTRKLVEESKALKTAIIEIRGKRVDIVTATEDDLKELAAAAEG